LTAWAPSLVAMITLGRESLARHDAFDRLSPTVGCGDAVPEDDMDW
jgi:hypothetical protein